MSRRVIGLLRAAPCESPWAAKPKRLPKGARGAGVSYERRVAKALEGALAHTPRYGQWFAYWDATGSHYCQTDVLAQVGAELVVVECKLRNVDEARAQLGGLYLPVVGAALGRPARGVVVVKTLPGGVVPGEVFPTIRRALESRVELPVVHWLGVRAHGLVG